VAEEPSKLQALVRLGRHLPQHVDLFFLLGFLAGNTERLHFVRRLEGAPVALRFVAGRSQIWPQPVLDATVRGVPLPLPGMVVSALAGTQDPICVQVVVDDPADQAYLEPLTVDSYADVKSDVQSLQERMRSIRARIDQSLDIYRECRRLLAEGTSADEQNLHFFLGLAEREIEGLNAELNRLRSVLQERGGREEP